jgi:hypothetical protein
MKKSLIFIALILLSSLGVASRYVELKASVHACKRFLKCMCKARAFAQRIKII